MSTGGRAGIASGSRAAGPRPPAAADGRGDADRALWGAMVGLALLGAVVAGYLTYVHYAELRPFCVAGEGCKRVQSSAYAELAGVPVAVLGLGGYALILAGLLVLRGEAQRATTAFLALVGFGFSLYLTYREVFTIEAICAWCVASAILMTALTVLGLVRFLRAD